VSSFTRPYARAFVEAAPKNYDFREFLKAGEAMAHAFAQNPTLRAFLLAPNVPKDAKRDAITELSTKVGMDVYGTRFLQVMLRNHRLLEAGAVFRALRDLVDDIQGILRVQVTVAAPLSDAEMQTIEGALAARTGRKIRMQIGVDPRIVGGFVARAESRVFDGSVTAAIRRFEEQLNQALGA
jgi:F-type H+-transporting ATPase subunit delta